MASPLFLSNTAPAEKHFDSSLLSAPSATRGIALSHSPQRSLVFYSAWSDTVAPDYWRSNCLPDPRLCIPPTLVGRMKRTEMSLDFPNPFLPTVFLAYV